MRTLLQKIRPRKADEMERHILFKAQRNAYFFLIFALLIRTFYESYRVYTEHTRLNPLPCLLLTGAVLIQGLSQMILSRNAVRGDEDAAESELRPGTLLRILAAVLMVAALAVTLTGLLLSR